MDNKKIIRVLFSAVIIVILMSAFAVPAYADGKYCVDSADFYVELQPNGDARIVEKWNLVYDGTFHRFRHGYMTSPPKVQQFDTIKALQFKIDGEVVPMEQGETDLTGRVLSDSGEKQLCWYKLIEGSDTAIYEADYLMTNVVKKNGDDIVFSCRFIGKNFDPSISSLNVYLKLVPGMELDNVRSNSGGTVEMKQNDVCYSISKSNNEGLYGLTYIFKQDGSSTYFTGNLTEVNASDINNVFKGISSGDINDISNRMVSTIVNSDFVVFFYIVGILLFSFLAKRLGKHSGSYRYSNYGSSSGCGSSCGGGCGSSCGGGCGGGGAD